MRKKWAIIADDFTGAGDSAVQFVSCGKPVLLVLDKDTEHLDSASLGTVVVDTDTRFGTGEESYRKVASVTRYLYDRGYRHFFKKIDSTLRGNPAEEIAAVMDEGGFRFALVAPAAPRNRRTVVDGVCLVDGVPLPETSIKHDPFTPVEEGQFNCRLQSRFPGAIEELRLSCVRSGTASLLEAIRQGLARGSRVFVSDAETMEDLYALAALSSVAGILFAGSSGLAEAVANGGGCSTWNRHAIPRNRILYSVGSLTDKSAVQCLALVDSGNIDEIVVDTARVLSDPAAEFGRILETLAGSSCDRTVLVRSDGIVRTSGSGGCVTKDAGVAISRFIGKISKEIVLRRRIRLVFASGGDTAARIVEELDTSSIRFVSEIIPGIPFGYLHSASLGRRMYFVTKSGGFGENDAMLRCLDLVSSGRGDGREDQP